MYYNSCPLCGANLDPGESCDCEEQTEQTETTEGDETDDGREI